MIPPEWPPGRPEDGEGGATASPADVEEVVTKHLITNAISLSTPRRHWRSARRESALRSAPLGTCGCRRDPDHDRHRCDPVSEQQVWGAVAAAHHLRERGLPPIFDNPTLRAMSRMAK